jgi:glycosyltransferase involved in cell wall biosynthesis
MVELSFTRSPKTITGPSKRTRTVAAIPCYNTERTIAEVVTKARKYVDEVIVIDDGSTDLTAFMASVAGASVISHDKNLGKGAAMKTALSQAHADIVVFIDGDGQHNPEDIPGLLKPIAQGSADYVIGSRYLSDSKVSCPPFVRKACNNAASFIISIIIFFVQPRDRLEPLGLSPNNSQTADREKACRSNDATTNYRLLTNKFNWITDCTSGFTAMKKQNWRRLNLISNRFEIEAEMIFEQARNGFVIAETPIGCEWGKTSSKLSIAKDGSKTLWLLVRKFVSFTITRGPRVISERTSILKQAR